MLLLKTYINHSRYLNFTLTQGLLLLYNLALTWPIHTYSTYISTLCFKYKIFSMVSTKNNWKWNCEKELSFCYKLLFSSPYICSTQYVADHWYFKLLILFDQKNLSLKYKRFYSIRLQRYKNGNIWVCVKNSIPLKMY